MLSKYYTRSELATTLKVSERTIERWENEGKIKGVQIKKRGVVRYSEEEIQKLLK